MPRRVPDRNCLAALILMARTSATVVNRGKRGSKPHLAGETGGLPLSVVVSAANANDHRRCRAHLRRRAIRSQIARHMVESSTRLAATGGRSGEPGERLGGWRAMPAPRAEMTTRASVSGGR